MTANTLFGNVSSLNATALRISNNMIIPFGVPPANTSAGAGIAGGTMFYNADFLYIATANNTVKRVALSTF
jgi:hypothetical protein